MLNIITCNFCQRTSGILDIGLEISEEISQYPIVIGESQTGRFPETLAWASYAGRDPHMDIQVPKYTPSCHHHLPSLYTSHCWSSASSQYEIVFPRDTGVGILTGLDDVQQQLDDHILKAQTMRGSPYVKAFEADMVAWEEKLISMQDILDQWLQVGWCWFDSQRSMNKVLLE